LDRIRLPRRPSVSQAGAVGVLASVVVQVFWSVNDSQSVRARVRRAGGRQRLAAGSGEAAATGSEGSQGHGPYDTFAATGDVPDLVGQRPAGPTASADGLRQRREEPAAKRSADLQRRRAQSSPADGKVAQGTSPAAAAS